MKLVFWLSVVLALAALNASSRETAARFVQLGLDPVYAWSTRSQITQITALLETERDAARPVPVRHAELVSLIARNYKSQDLILDAWGTEFFLEYRTGTVRVVSAGPDRIRATEDDLRGRPVAARRQ